MLHSAVSSLLTSCFSEREDVSEEHRLRLNSRSVCQEANSTWGSVRNSVIPSSQRNHAHPLDVGSDPVRNTGCRHWDSEWISIEPI
jgi:hypothetical protein